MAETFREQGRSMGAALRRTPVDPADTRAEAAMDGVWSIVSRSTGPAFVAGMRAATLAGMAWGIRRFVEDVMAAEAVGVYRAPPARGLDLPHVEDPRLGRLVAILTGTPFALAHPRAVEQAFRHAAELVAGIDEETRDRLRRIVGQGRLDGLSSERLARRITAEFPHMAVGRPQLHITSRAHMVAVTETAFAYERGQRIGADESAAAGLTMVKSWLTVGDGRVDDDCLGNEAEGEIPHDGTFGDGSGEPPAHPACRCTAQYRALTSAELAGLASS